jgi:hypothetical protein
LSTDRVLIKLGSVEDFESMVALLAATQAQRFRSREFALNGPTITATQAAAIEGLRRLDGVHVTPKTLPESWTVDGDAAPIPELSFGEAERWWKSTQR